LSLSFVTSTHPNPTPNARFSRKPLSLSRVPFSGEEALQLPPNIPVKTFWSVIPYDTQTRSVLQTDQRDTALSSETGTVKPNPDGSVDIYFGPNAPTGEESNWIQTVPGKGWFILLRLYSPLESWFDKSWRPGEIELVK
jgi:hypothetical protein